MATLVLAGCAGSSEQPIDEPPELTGDAVHAEFGKAMYRCLREAGWDTTLDEDGNARTSFPEEQEEAFDAAWRDCMNRLGYDKDPPPLTDAEETELYRDTLDLVACLEGLGYTITDVPSEQVFKDGAIFVPYAQLPESVLAAHYEEIKEKCPQPEIFAPR